MTLKGLIFDFDGLILDTELPVFNAWQELFDQNGYSFTHEHYGRIIGSDTTTYDPADHLSRLTGHKYKPEQLRQLTLERSNQLVFSQPVLPGVLDFILNARKNSLKMAVASSSSRSWVEGHLKRLDLYKYFDCVCTADDVQKVKPDPELFLLAASKLGLDPSEVIVFEDSPNGITAAKSAGIYCIAVPNQITSNMDTSHADRNVESFHDINPLELKLFFNKTQ